MLVIKLSRKEDGNLHTDDLQYSYKLVHSKERNLCKTLSSFRLDFTCNIAKQLVEEILPNLH